MTKHTQLTQADETALRLLVDEKIAAIAKGEEAGVADRLAPFFLIRAKLASEPKPEAAKLARKDRCPERLGKRRCVHALGHDGSHLSHDGREFGPDIVQPKAGWVSSASEESAQ